MKSTFFTILLAFCASVYAENPESLAKAQLFAQSQKAAFEENKGQVTGADAPQVKFHYRKGGLSVFLLEGGIAYQFTQVHYPEGYKPLDKFATEEERKAEEALREQIRTETYRMDVVLEGANPQAEITSEGKSSDYIQYYNHDALDVHSYEKVTYHNVYPHIDWVVYTEGENLKYDFVVHPGGNPSDIHLKTKWVESLTLNPNGSLTFQNQMGSIEEQAPISFQGREKVATRFLVEGEHISFSLGSYDKTRDLVIDPLVWATYYGGGSNDVGYSCAVNSTGNVYLAGYTASTSSIASGGHQNTYGGLSADAFMVKFDAAGVRLWATYYGGSDTDYGYSCAVDTAGNVYLAGSTRSITDIASGGYQNNHQDDWWDAFLVKFDASGVRQWATYYGGNDTDFGTLCAVDALANVYLVGGTSSNNDISLGGHQNNRGGGLYDAFLVKFSGTGIRQWATYYGGGSDDYGLSCAVDATENVYLAGYTESTSAIASGGHQNTYGGDRDAFLVKFSNTGTRLWATYYGETGRDGGEYCAVDGLGNVYLVGYTESTSAIVSGGHQNTYGGSRDAFLVKFSSAGSRQWATYYGGGNIDYGLFCTVDALENVYLVGYTESTSAIASGGYQNIYGGGSKDAFLVKFSSAGIRQWATYYGGNAYDSGISCAIDTVGNAYLTGSTESTSSIASGGHQNSYGGYRDAFLAKFDGQGGATALNPTTAPAPFTLYPNPVSETLYLEFANEGQRFSYYVLNDLGQILSQGSSDTEITSVSTQNWTPGVYFLQIETQGKHYTQKVVKQ